MIRWKYIYSTFQLYEYCRKQLIKGFSKNVVDGIRKGANAIKDISEASKSRVVEEQLKNHDIDAYLGYLEDLSSRIADNISLAILKTLLS